MADDEKQQANPPSETINIKVKAQKTCELFFRIKKNSQVTKLMTEYCAHPSVNFRIFEFLFNGRRLRGDETPLQLGMEDGDEIDAMRHFYGGGATT